MHQLQRGLVAAALAVAALLVSASPASAATVEVHPGESIQDAIDAAPPGSTIVVHAGVYRETLLIRKHGIKLIGKGDDKNGTVLERPARANSFCGESPNSFPGICVLATEINFDTFEVITPVNNVRIEGFLVRNFPGDGIVAFGSNNTTFVNNTAANNESYGITSFVSTNNVYDRLVARDNGAPGFYIGDTPNANFTLTNSFSFGNELGILIREANNGTIRNNRFYDNCAGILVLNHGNDPAFDIRVQDWWIEDNEVLHNNRPCQGETGIGVALLGSKNVTLENNVIKGNQPPPDQGFGGGVIVINSKFDGGDNPVGNTVRNNTILNNRPLDVFYDGTGSGNTFPNNECNRSQPGFICD